MSFKELLIKTQKERGFPIRVGLIGAGQMGTGLISQIEKMEGIRVVAVADVMKDRANSAYHESGIAKEIVLTNDNDPLKAAKSIEDGKRIASHNSEIVVEIPNLDVIVESTGIPEVGAKVCYSSLLNNRLVVNMNVEADTVIGYYLSKMAKSVNSVYTLIAGDEPGSVKELYDFANTLGFEIVCIGKGKNNTLDTNANPDSVLDLAKKKNINPKMLASFVDGTKTMAEMTSMANGTGFKPDIRGAHGPRVEVIDLPKIFIPKKDGGILETTHVVDYAVGNIAPGVFIIITTDQPKIIADLKYLNSKYGNGNYWALYRPYHLCNLEAPISILRAFFYHEETLATYLTPVAETIAMAKRDLCPGENIDCLGGYTVYGTIEKAEIARKENIVPLGLIVGARVIRKIEKNQPIHYSDIELNEDQFIYHLRYLQDKELGYL